MIRESVRMQQPDGPFKAIFRENPDNQKGHEKNTHESRLSAQESKEKHKQKKQIANPRYFYPLNPDRIGIFGMDLLNKDIVFSFNYGESIKGKMTGYVQYEILIQSDGKKFIVMKQAISTVEVL